MHIVDAPIQDNEPQVTLFDPEFAIGGDKIPDNLCQRCKRNDGGTVSRHVIVYPNGWHQFACCANCKDQISIALDTAIERLGL